MRMSFGSGILVAILSARCSEVCDECAAKRCKELVGGTELETPVPANL